MGFKKDMRLDEKPSSLIQGIRERCPIIFDKAMTFCEKNIDNEFEDKLRADAVKMFVKLVDKMIPNTSVSLNVRETGDVDPEFAEMMIEMKEQKKLKERLQNMKSAGFAEVVP